MDLRFGIIGLGRIGVQQLQCVANLSGLKVTAVAEPHVRVGLPQGLTHFTQWEHLLADPRIDAVSICTPHHTHEQMVEAALKAGKHVLVEKPLAMSAARGRNLLEMARQLRRVLMVELTHRFYPAFQDARKFVQAGQLGRLYAVEDRIIEPATAQIVPWMRQVVTAGGGVAMTSGIHMLDRIAAITGRPLQFHSGVARYDAHLGDVEDTAAMFLTLDSGVPVQLLAAWPSGDSQVDDELTLYGTKGTLRLWAWRGWRFEPVAGDQGPFEQNSYPSEAGSESIVRLGLRGALKEFGAAIMEHRQPNPSAGDAIVAQELIESFYRHVGGSEVT
ncbi:MAG: Gfo/Idh/MocA family oxidoreductase [Phycisphaerales bacterium]|nr:Gfo/Idh/MocA family oxidoreductase [Phycisphaerales bacterium]